MKTITLIIAGPTQQNVAEKVGNKKEWYSRLISRDEVQIQVKDVYLGDKVDHRDGDAWIITGSEYSVYDDYPWLKSLEFVIREAVKINKTIFGVCFGHQLIAKALGGNVSKNPLGWEVGGCQVILNVEGLKSPVFNGLPETFYCAETHQDAVLELPKGCIELASNNMGNQAFQYGNTVFGVQFHPEFTQGIMKEYVQLRLDAGIPVLFPDIPDLSHTEKIFDNFINHYILGDKYANSIIYN